MICFFKRKILHHNLFSLIDYSYSPCMSVTKIINFRMEIFCDDFQISDFIPLNIFLNHLFNRLINAN
jgi:hypothetical protein